MTLQLCEHTGEAVLSLNWSCTHWAERLVFLSHPIPPSSGHTDFLRNRPSSDSFLRNGEIWGKWIKIQEKQRERKDKRKTKDDGNFILRLLG